MHFSASALVQIRTRDGSHGTLAQVPWLAVCGPGFLLCRADFGRACAELAQAIQ